MNYTIVKSFKSVIYWHKFKQPFKKAREIYVVFTFIQPLNSLTTRIPDSMLSSIQHVAFVKYEFINKTKTAANIGCRSLCLLYLYRLY
jgi:hypothetical protein